MNRRIGSLLIAVVLVVSGCAAGGTANQGRAPTSLTVFAAASLKSALERATTAFETANPGLALTLSTDSSAALRTQIEQGAPADVFLSADTTNPQRLVDSGLASGAPINFAGNVLTIIVPRANPANLASPADLAKPGVKIIAAGDEVPITKYASQLVGKLATEAGYPTDFAARYAANLVSREDNVRAIVTKVELGEGDAGIVYATDAKSSTKIARLDPPDAANVPATYAGVVVKASKQPEQARAFLDWLAGSAGQAILVEFGFTPPR